jgi:hypothetical protein
VEPDSLNTGDVDLIGTRWGLESLLLVRQVFQPPDTLQIFVHLLETIASIGQVSGLRLSP